MSPSPTADRAVATPPRPRWRPGPWDAAGLLLALSFSLPAWFYPHGNDQGLHWYLGQGILRGELPFAHGISGKPIGIFVIHALASGLLGPGQWVIRAAEAFTLLGMAWLMPALLRGRDEPRRDGEIGAAAVALFGVHYTFFDYWDVSHPETWVSLCMLAAAHLSLGGAPSGRAPSARRVFAIGALSGAAFMIKYTAALVALPISAYCGWRAMVAALGARQNPALAVLRAAGQFLAGVALAFALCVLPFWIGGALGPMWEVLYTFTARYVSMAPGVPYRSLWIRPEFGGYALGASAGLLVVGLALWSARRRWALVARGGYLFILTAASLLTVVMQGRYFSYHFTVASVWLALCIGYGLRALFATRPRLQLGLAVALVAAAVAVEPRWSTNRTMSYAEHTQQLLRYLRDDISRRAYLRAFQGKNRLDRYWIHEHVGLQARKRAKPGDQLCARGFAPGIYQVSGLRCPSRHVIQMWPAGLPYWDNEFWHTIEVERPRFVVTFRDRPKELQRLRKLGYKARRMPSLFVLMEHPSS